MTCSDACSVLACPPSLRFLSKNDIPQLSQIDGMSYIFGESHNCWTTRKFLRCLAYPGCAPPILAVDKKTQEPQGFMIYRSKNDHFEIMRMAVDPGHRGDFAISIMVSKLINKLIPRRRERILCSSFDGAINTHNALKSNGFRSTEVLRNRYEVDGICHDAYCFEYRLVWTE